MARQVDNKIEQHKKALIEALTKSLGNVSTACKAVGVGRGMFYVYYEQDETFRQAVIDIKEAAIDFAESALMKQINEGNTAATIFFLKTQGKTRGYVERQELASPGGGPVFEGVEVVIKRSDETKD